MGPPGPQGENAENDINVEIFKAYRSEWSYNGYLFHATSLLNQSVVDSGAVFLYLKVYWENHDSIWKIFDWRVPNYYSYKLDTLIMFGGYLDHVYPNDSDTVATFKLVTISHTMEYQLLGQGVDPAEYLKNYDK